MLRIENIYEFKKHKGRSATPNKVQGLMQLATGKKKPFSLSLANRAATPMGTRTDHRDAELKEVGYRLSILHKHFNLSKLNETKQTKKLTALQEQLNALPPSQANRGDLSATQDALQQALAKQQQALLDQKTNLHVLERMRHTKVALERKINLTREELRQVTLLLASEAKRSVLSKERQHLSENMYRTAMTSYQLHRSREVQLCEGLQRDIAKQSQLARKRISCDRRQALIAEEAANELRDKRAGTMREQLKAWKLWHLFLTNKLNRVKANSWKLEKAFSDIRKLSGSFDIQTVVHKFLTRETAYFNLQDVISNARRGCDEYRDKIALIEKKVHALMITNNQTAKEPNTQEITYVNKLRTLGKTTDRLQRVKNVITRVHAWADRVLTRVGLEDTTNQPLPQVFGRLKSRVRALLGQVGPSREVPFSMPVDIAAGLQAPPSECSEELQPRELAGVPSEDLAEVRSSLMPLKK